MIKLHVVQAEYGDCFILESKISKKSTNILIDGGPYQTFQKHLKPTIQELILKGKFDLMVLSHIDNDHIIGLLDLLEEIKTEREKGEKELVKIEKIWHNSFKDLLELPVEPNNLLGNTFAHQNAVGKKTTTQSLVMKGFEQGTDLTKLGDLLGIPINVDFEKIIVINDQIRSVHLNDVVLHILGPSKINVDKLQKEWDDWSRKKKNASVLLQILDKSVPNLASITFLAEINDKKILFTGDSLGQDIVEVLSKNGMCDDNGRFYVDVLKVPHHGSDRNSSSEFFNTVIADYYIISANGRDDNPSLSTLRWIIESERSGKKSKKIVFTNMTPNVKKILQEYDRRKFNFEYVLLENEKDFLTIKL